MRRPLVLAALAAALVLGALLVFRRPPYTTSEVRWQNGPVALAGTLYLPDGDGPCPAAVFVHGAGGWTRSERLFRVHAERLAEMGLAMVIYDKRGCGESSGDWRQASFEDLAEDALGAVRLLREHARVHADRIGLFATSQGSSVALLAAARSPDVAFLATLSLSTQSASEHGRDIAARGVTVRVEETPRSRDFDPLPLLRTLELPLFAAQGAEDELVPGPRAAAELEALKHEHGNDFTIVLVPGVGHTLRPWPAAYWEALEAWLAARVL